MKTITFEEACKHKNAHFVLRKYGLLNRDGSINNQALLKHSDEDKELFAFSIQNWGDDAKKAGMTPIVADFYQLTVPAEMMAKGGKAEEKVFNKDNRAKLLIPNAKVEIEHFLMINSNYKKNGRYYVLKEKEAEEYQAELAADIARREKAALEAENAGKALSGALSSLVEGAKGGKPVKAPKIWVVDIDGNVQEYKGKPEEFNADDYLHSGTKAACEKYVKDNK